jgi:hypothetical protein
MSNKDWAEEIKRLYLEGYSLKDATEKVLRMIEEYRGLKNGN